MKHCSTIVSQYEAASFHSAMKHSLRSYYEKMKNESWSDLLSEYARNPHKISPNSPL